MMNVLIAPLTSGYEDVEWGSGDVDPLAEAIDVFSATELISVDVAQAAKRDVSAGESESDDRMTLRLRAV
ncbi:hypothetical protein [Gordonia shandongensis]|uniref:hypothetical protein n=1 Tax=Gordonia shandongensis TaxID=376351 RepID=UPI000411EDBE|nr:hypothetical protein [Gordonia shandongensis]